MTFDEYMGLFINSKQKKRSINEKNYFDDYFNGTTNNTMLNTTMKSLPKYVDWRNKYGYVQPVKNQGFCGLVL